MDKVRIDKWLWAARFFKTRSLAKTAIDGGKVHADGQRVKASKEIMVGQVLTIRQGWDEKDVEVLGLSDKRGPAPVAQQLYQETPESIAKREAEAEKRKVMRGIDLMPEQRPTKKQRRQIHRFREQDYSG
ncbi:RNA-binding S4 domain-containing protein [Pseudoteredinibacter isoporae]|uniref:Heat shock protein 15 n=1 Tax=Pseudoteredinibacter isoporae TaxID=570281 RepID=A0A7X0MUR2_9GAMM|nr:S4 domain-containing protein [Pseudoteredinibacter isoporae]MBB6520563.1 ribosome-associated heat shock protein Hsp15 [Pseudoteredinibacter isoporae]NHO86130.1 RNA-binding protein [Pseudoteredinibacter isoporae]NIB25419.1 RNA-binding protein [Pseudoteredinibacter isoporae]